MGSLGGGFGAWGAGLVAAFIGVAGFLGWQFSDRGADAEDTSALVVEVAETQGDAASEEGSADASENSAEDQEEASEEATSPDEGPEVAEEAGSDAAPAAEVEAEIEAEAEPAVAAEAETASAEPTGDEPVLDVVRIDAQGGTVIAGQAAPNTLVRLMLDGEEVASDTADASGNFVIFATLPAADEARALSLEGTSADGTALAGLQTIMVSAIQAPDVVADAATTEQAEEGAVEIASTDTTAATIREQPTIVILDADGPQVVQRGGEEAQDETQVSLDLISYGSDGEVFLSGSAAPETRVQIYIDNAPVEVVEVASSGTWDASLLGVAPGNFTLRLDAVDAQGGVVSRLETPFQRATPEAVAAAMAQAEADTQAAGSDQAEEVSDMAAGAEGASSDTAPAQADEAGSDIAASQGQPEAEVAEAASEEAAEAAPAPTTRVITVQAGFTLWEIARSELGDPIRYVQVYEANRDLIRDPDLIYPGQIFTIPDADPDAGADSQ